MLSEGMVTVRRWWRRKRSHPVGNWTPSRNNLVEVQHEFAGAWVAMKNGEVVDARPTPYDLIASLQSRGIKDTTIIRVPAESEPELVGLG
jgi:Family of unknown function (DUF5678)